MTIDPDQVYTCPLCSLEFADGGSCRPGCPMSRGCGMIKCPRCSFEFVEKSWIVSALKRVFRRQSSAAAG